MGYEGISVWGTKNTDLGYEGIRFDQDFLGERPVLGSAPEPGAADLLDDHAAILNYYFLLEV